MNLLLDTHIWVWSLMAPERLSKRVARALLAEGSELWLSPISVWEVCLLIERKRIALDLQPEEWVERAIAAAPVREAPLTFEIARESRSIALEHPDPADRFIAATAKVLDLTLVTADRRLVKLNDCAVLANS